MGFFIECTITEVKIKKDDLFIKIRGTDGYVLCQDSRTHNIFFPTNLGKPGVLSPNITASAMVLDVESFVVLSNQLCHCLSLCPSCGCRAKIIFESCVYSDDCKAYRLNDSEIIFH